MPGEYDLRAVATDLAAQTDPDAGRASRSTYGDTTPPPAPTGLVARVDGADVTLVWTPVTAPDLASYRLYRDGERIAQDLTEPRHVDPGLAPQTYEYVVTAVDVDGNESAPSAPAEAVVYAVRLEEPGWPVVSSSSASVNGDGSRPRTTVQVLREGAGIAEGAGAGGAFRVDGVPLVADGNLLTARGEDADGNRSIPSNEIVLIGNTPPAAVADLTRRWTGGACRWPGRRSATPTSSATWSAATASRSPGPCRRTSAGAFQASVAQDWARYAFDRNPTTAWPPSAATGEWTVHFASPILVERIALRFAGEGDAPQGPARYTLLARWQDRYVPIVRVRDGARLSVSHRLPAWFATDAIRVALESPGRIAEIGIDRLDVVPAGASVVRGRPGARGLARVRGRRDRPLRCRRVRRLRQSRRGRRRAAGAAHRPRGHADRPGRAAHLERESRAGRHRATSFSATARASAGRLSRRTSTPVSRTRRTSTP